MWDNTPQDGLCLTCGKIAQFDEFIASHTPLANIIRELIPSSLSFSTLGLIIFKTLWREYLISRIQNLDIHELRYIYLGLTHGFRPK